MRLLAITEELKTLMRDDFNKFIEGPSSGTKVSYSFDYTQFIPKDIKTPTVLFTASAYLKLMALVDTCPKEIAWHGLVNKSIDAAGKPVYTIYDILFYPQKATATTVVADDEKYAMWLMGLPDGVFEYVRFQGHSHVNMTTSPSGKDTSNWAEFTDITPDDEYYIFCIANKSASFYWEICDKANNIVFENKDISWGVILEDGSLVNTWATTEIGKYFVEEKATTWAPGNTIATPAVTHPRWWEEDLKKNVTPPASPQTPKTKTQTSPGSKGGVTSITTLALPHGVKARDRYNDVIGGM